MRISPLAVIVVALLLGPARPAAAQDEEQPAPAPASEPSNESGGESGGDPVAEAPADESTDEAEEEHWDTDRDETIVDDAEVDKTFGAEGIPGGGGEFVFSPEEPPKKQPISGVRAKMVEVADAEYKWGKGKRHADLKPRIKTYLLDGVRHYTHKASGRRLAYTDADWAAMSSKWDQKQKKRVPSYFNWCAAFTSYVLRQAGADLGGFDGSTSAKVLLERFKHPKNAGRFREYGEGVTPRAGDVMISEWSFKHASIVVMVNTGDGTFWTVEPNWTRRGVFSYQKWAPGDAKRSKIIGFFDPEPPPPPAPAPSESE